MDNQQKFGIDSKTAGLFFVSTGTFSGSFITPDGDRYDIRELEPHEFTHPYSGIVTTIWGGYATARDRDVAARDAVLQSEFKKTGQRPVGLFAPEARDIPLYVTLLYEDNTDHTDFTEIGSFWNARGRYEILAIDSGRKSGFGFEGLVVARDSYKNHDAEFGAALRQLATNDLHDRQASAADPTMKPRRPSRSSTVKPSRPTRSQGPSS